MHFEFFFKNVNPKVAHAFEIIRLREGCVRVVFTQLFTQVFTQLIKLTCAEMLV